jgi:hypothetical protein
MKIPNLILIVLTITVLSIIALVNNLFPQVTQEWVARYNGPGNAWDWGTSIATDAAGNIYVAGYSVGSGTSEDYVTIKYNSSGVQQWVQRYNGPGNNDDNAYSMVVDGSGNVYVTGGSNQGGIGLDYATIKYSSSGGQQWVATYNGPPGNHDDFANAIAIDDSENVYVTGWSNASGSDTEDYATLKYNSSGVQQWVQRYDGPGNSRDLVRSIAVDSSRNVYVTGSSRIGATNETADYATIKYNSSGVQQWLQRYNGPGNYVDIAFGIAIDGFGRVYVTGGSSSGGSNTQDVTTIQLRSLTRASLTLQVFLGI